MNGPEAPQNRLKAEVVAEAFAGSGLEVMGLSSADWQLGSDVVFSLVERHQLPVVAAVWSVGTKPFPSHIVVEAGGKRLGFVGVTEGQVTGCSLHDPVRSIEEALNEMGEVDVRVLLLPVSARKLESFKQVRADLALLLGGQRARGWTEDSPIPLTIPARGKTLAQLRLTWKSDGVAWRLDESNEQSGVLLERLKRRVDSVERRLTMSTTEERYVGSSEGSIRKTVAGIGGGRHGTSETPPHHIILSSTSS